MATFFFASQFIYCQISLEAGYIIRGQEPFRYQPWNGIRHGVDQFVRTDDDHYYFIGVNTLSWKNFPIDLFIYVEMDVTNRISAKSGLEIVHIANVSEVRKPSVELSGSLIGILQVHEAKEVHVPLMFNWRYKKWLFLHGGMSTNFRFAINEPRKSVDRFVDEYWTEEEKVSALEPIKDIFRPVMLTYRYGLTLRPVKRLGIEFTYVHSMSNLLREGILERNGRKYSVNFQYGYFMNKLVYYFQLGKE